MAGPNRDIFGIIQMGDSKIIPSNFYYASNEDELKVALEASTNALPVTVMLTDSIDITTIDITLSANAIVIGHGFGSNIINFTDGSDLTLTSSNQIEDF